MRLLSTYLFQILALSLLCFVGVSCSDSDGDYLPNNAIEGSDGVGIRSLEFSLPIFDRLVSLLDVEVVTLELHGERDLKNYDLDVEVEPKRDGVISLKAISPEVLLTMPHQRYYVNFIKFTKDDAVSRGYVNNGLFSITLGAILTIEDPNNISVVSSYNSELDSFGDGSEDDPFTIVTMLCFEKQILNRLTTTTAVKPFDECHFVQTRDLDFEKEYAFFDGWTAAGKFNIYKSGVSFHGTYDGGHHKFQQLFVDNNSSTGLFYKLGDGSVVKNLTVDNVNLKGGECVGVIACQSEGDVLIQNVDIHGACSGYDSVGGMIGRGSANFKDCYSEMSITHNGKVTASEGNYIGGFIGEVTGDSSFQVCSFDGYMMSSESQSMGGFVGGIEPTESVDISFINCVVSGGVSCNDESSIAGGLIGYCGGNSNLNINNVTIGAAFKIDPNDDSTDTYFGDSPELYSNAFDIMGVNHVGGYIGYVDGANMVILNGNDNYVSERTKISGDSYVGGLFGAVDGGSNSTTSIMVFDSFANRGALEVQDAYSGGAIVGEMARSTFKSNGNSYIYSDMDGYKGSVAAFVGRSVSGKYSNVNLVCYDPDMPFFNTKDSEPDSSCNFIYAD